MRICGMPAYHHEVQSRLCGLTGLADPMVLDNTRGLVLGLNAESSSFVQSYIVRCNVYMHEIEAICTLKNVKIFDADEGNMRDEAETEKKD